MLIDKYRKVFEEPKHLLSYHNMDHCIHLQMGSSLVNVQPYRDPYFQKEAMEKLVQDMLENGVIQHSNSPFSSLVVFVKKKDRS